jgi:transcription elongation factor Elf1
MDRFNCLGCKIETLVRHVKCDATGTYFVCEHCGAEHAVDKRETPRDQPARFQVVGLRDQKAESA